MTHAEELERLSELHRKGDLTDEEFAAEKKRLVWTQFRRIYEAVEGFADYFVNSPHAGFFKKGDKTRCAKVELDRYEV